MCYFVFFNDTATTEIYTLSLHDALPISSEEAGALRPGALGRQKRVAHPHRPGTAFSGVILPSLDRKSTRLNSSHANISYAVFCLKKKKNTNITIRSVDITLSLQPPQHNT